MRDPRREEKAVPEAGGLWAVDRLLLAALAVLAVLTGTFHPEPARCLLVFGALALFLWAAARLDPRSRAGDALHAFAPLVVVVGVFETVGFVVGVVNPVRWDAFFSALDLRLFGGLVAAWRGAFGRPSWLSDVMSAFYFSYYVVPPAMAIALYARGRREDFDRLIFGLQVTLLLSYAGYFLFPTSGPRVGLPEAGPLLGGGPLSQALRVFLHSCEFNAFDAFPSGHTAASLVFLAYGWRMFPRWRLPLALTVVCIVFSTVYLSHHYVVDLIAGAAVAALSLAAMPLVHRAFGFVPGPWRIPAKDTLPS